MNKGNFVSCAETDQTRAKKYDELMKTTIASKLAEKGAKFFDGELEPSFPDKKIKDSTFLSNCNFSSSRLVVAKLRY